MNDLVHQLRRDSCVRRIRLQAANKIEELEKANEAYGKELIDRVAQVEKLQAKLKLADCMLEQGLSKASSRHYLSWGAMVEWFQEAIVRLREE